MTKLCVFYDCFQPLHFVALHQKQFYVKTKRSILFQIFFGGGVFAISTLANVKINKQHESKDQNAQRLYHPGHTRIQPT